jgi:hypothetical protein
MKDVIKLGKEREVNLPNITIVEPMWGVIQSEKELREVLHHLCKNEIELFNNRVKMW